ncbi:MAG: NAD-dependent nucleoside diphosphate-sugar epimerase/dehydratase [Bacteroidetes bacterium]|nr:NAD-dependent nucleoside diphosphate-sugar epimerase/dehydratase [Bacteroidota bacterium]
MLNIAVTGAGGFVGKQLFKKEQNSFNFHRITMDDIKHTKINKSDKIDHVIHLAAKTFVPDSWENPSDFYQVNVMGTQHVLDYCKKMNCSLTYVSSYVYGMPNRLPINEEHEVAPNTPYNHSKFIGEELCRFYHKYFNIDIAIIRPFNLFGPFQDQTFLIPKIMHQIIKGKNLDLESLTPKRDYLFIDDFIELLFATVRHKGCDVFNAGSGISYSVNEIAELAIRVSGYKNIQIQSKNNIRTNEVMDVVADVSKAARIFSWKPKITLEEGLKKIFDEQTN